MLTPHSPPSQLSQGHHPLPMLSSFSISFSFLSKYSQENTKVTRIAQRGIDHLFISMARDAHKFLYDQEEEDYIDMDVNSSTFFCYSPQSREFEFHMTNNLKEREVATSPADELFYKGKLLPLHLPPRLQMVQKLLQNTPTNDDQDMDSPELNYFTAEATPYASCNISPSESCHVSRELKPEDYMELKSGVEGSFNMDQPKKSWSKKLKLIKQSSLGSKLKASRAYLKSLFTKSACSAEDAARNVQGFAISRPRELSNTYIKVAKKNPSGQIQRERYQVGPMDLRSVCTEKASDVGTGVHRRSFSGAIQRNLGVKPSPSPTSSSSSSSSSCSSFSGYRSLSGLSSSQFLRRSSSGGSDVECSIQGAIAHCKQSQQLCYARKSVSDVGLCSLSASMIAACEKDWPGMCRG